MVDVNHISKMYWLYLEKKRCIYIYTHLVTAFQFFLIYIQLPVGESETHKRTRFSRRCWPCFSLLMKQKLGSLHCLTNPSKCLIAAFLLVLISKRMELAGLSEVINIRGHKAMLIEWFPHCHAQGASLLTPFQSQSLSSLCLSHPFFSCMLLIQVPWRPSIAGAGFSHQQL